MASSRYWIAALLIAASGCGGGAPADNKKPYTGTVSWNGAPLPSGTLSFYGDKGAVDAAPIENGKFTIRTAPGVKGVGVIAEKEIGTPPPTARIPNPTPVKFQYLPKEANTASTLKQTISDKAETPIVIDLKGKDLEPPKDALKPSE